MENLAEFYQKKVARFIKTVVCFDDMAYPQEKDKGKKRATPARDGFEDESDTAVPETAQVEETPPDDASGEFDARAITDAFASKEILCSVVVPDSEPEKALVQIKNLMRAADVTILDWMLADHDTSIARRAISETLMDDKNNGGRLRLIVIYSLSSGKDVISELAEELREHGFQLDEASLELQNEHSLIVFLHKEKVLKPVTDPVLPESLPDRVIESFVKLTSGLLPSAALTAISVIRDRTPQLLATFSAELDGAFLAHRCLVPNPADAERYLLDLIEGEIRSLLTHSSVHEAVDSSRCMAWIEGTEMWTDSEKARLLKALTKYSRSKIDGFKKLFDSSNMDDKNVAKTVLKLLYKKCPDSLNKSKENISILSTLDCSTRTYRILKGKLPRLHLGSIVQDRATQQYLLCVQPLCDSVRIKHNKDTIFPFLILHNQGNDDKKKLDICVPHRDGRVNWLMVAPTPNNLCSYLFRGKSKSDDFVEANKDEHVLTFETTGGLSFQWIADLKIGKAQRIASELAARIHTLGIDEFEWMRIHQ